MYVEQRADLVDAELIGVVEPENVSLVGAERRDRVLDRLLELGLIATLEIVELHVRRERHAVEVAGLAATDLLVLVAAHAQGGAAGRGANPTHERAAARVGRDHG